MSARCIFFICCSLGDRLVTYLWCTYGLWWTCDGLVDLFGWTWALIIIYVIYIVIDVICADGCVDWWDIYVMDEIYMWYMFVWIYLSWWNLKKIKIVVLGHFAECCTRQRTPLPSVMVTTLGKAEKMGARKTIFQLCRVPWPWYSAKIFFKKIQTLPSVGQRTLGKYFF